MFTLKVYEYSNIAHCDQTVRMHGMISAYVCGIFNVVVAISTMGKIFSRRHIEYFFFIFPRKQKLIFHGSLPESVFWEKISKT